MDFSTDEKLIVRQSLEVYAAIICVWIVLWIIKSPINDPSTFLGSSLGGVLFWTVAKVIVWILPSLYLIRFSNRTVGDVFNVTAWRQWLVWGVGSGMLVAIINTIPKIMANQPLVPPHFAISYMSAGFITPILEEFFMRGALMGNMQKQFSFWKANVITSVLFLGLHLPGWYFMGTLVDNFTKPIGGAFSIFLLGLLFGYVTHKGKSVLAGTIVHSLNNLTVG
ncbi:CPBP family intramembrane metalloprotease [candidate division WWE3 bacterium]|nr:CPBP family intramembrane metalloprotease [candidate division WWE3 bacterium]